MIATSELCDRCPATAQQRVTLPGGAELTFCGHHANKAIPALPPGTKLEDLTGTADKLRELSVPVGA